MESLWRTSPREESNCNLQRGKLGHAGWMAFHPGSRMKKRKKRKLSEAIDGGVRWRRASTDGRKEQRGEIAAGLAGHGNSLRGPVASWFSSHFRRTGSSITPNGIASA
ncbi:hypothetical protein K0M31_004403 [Melipona bicolor]|uniref:Uncharacterized protein n=1 Tax=Melipona bicolor TaxID=60889 RepID=A0AA40FXF4_9HYME|nr:hypothetical protein K0M31_004403 [Melipona bicolor]